MDEVKLSTSDISELMGVTTQAVRDYIRQGRMRATKKRWGLRWRHEVALSDFVAFVRENEVDLVGDISKYEGRG